MTQNACQQIRHLPHPKTAESGETGLEDIESEDSKQR